MKTFQKDDDFKRLFHYTRKRMFASHSLIEMKKAIEELLNISVIIDHKTIYDPMKNFEAVRFELEAILYGIGKWDAIKSIIINMPGITQTAVIKDLSIDKEKTSLFLYRVSLFGILRKIKVNNRNAYQYIGEELDPNTTIKNWDNLWEIPYESFQKQY